MFSFGKGKKISTVQGCTLQNIIGNSAITQSPWRSNHNQITFFSTYPPLFFLISSHCISKLCNKTQPYMFIHVSSEPNSVDHPSPHSRHKWLSASSSLLTLFNTSSLHQRAGCYYWCVKAVTTKEPLSENKAVPGLVVTVMDHQEEFIVITSTVRLNDGADGGVSIDW